MTKNRTGLLNLAEMLHSLNHQNRLSEEIYQQNFQETEEFADYCELSETQALIFASCLILGYSGSSIAAVFRHFGLEEHELLHYRKDIEVLFKRKLLEKVRNKDKRRFHFSIPDEVYSAVCTGSPLPDHQKIEQKNLVDLLQIFNELSDEFDNHLLSEFEFKNHLETFIDENAERPVFNEMKLKNLNLFEIFFFLDTIWDAIESGNNRFNTNVESTINDFFISKSKAFAALTNITDGFSILTKSDFIELSNSEFRNRCRAKISKRMIQFLQNEEKLEINDNSVQDSKLIPHRSIAEKKLFYNDRTTENLILLDSLLAEKSFSVIQNRLKNKSMPIGVAVLLYGEPGVGKTESVYQLAKSTQRNIFHVDISDTRSMWFGESQKLVKKIFSDYYEIRKKEKNCPILLFNEADAVIGKRKPSGSSGVSDTENAIQNILLEEMEKFNGILFATTNLHENIDNAFERRFLFKIKFEKPTTKNAFKIWKEKLPYLNDNQAKILSQDFPFSGGEIENISRKCLMKEIIYGKPFSFEEIQIICSEEKWGKHSQVKIGFQKV